MNPPSRALGVLCLFAVLTGRAGKRDSTTGSPVPDRRLHNPQTALEWAAGRAVWVDVRMRGRRT